MSILINREMPKNCGECPCCENTFYQCNINGARFFKVRDAYEKRHPDCPLIEIPPHGRLIDADAFLADMACAVATKMQIENAPTIIEAEGEDGSL